MGKFILFTLLLAGLLEASGGQRTDKVFLQENAVGAQTLQTEPDGTTRAEYSFSDRGRGDHIVARWKLDAAGVPTEYEGHGNDYMKAPIAERFEIKNGKASWKNRSEQGEETVTGEAFYLPANAPPEMNGVLARALLKAPGHKLALLPAGEASIEESGKVKIASDRELTQFRITGLDFKPQPIWLDADGNTAGILSDWFSTIAAQHESALSQLKTVQLQADTAWAGGVAREVSHVPNGDLLIRNARLFDPRDLSVTAGISVLVRDERIIRVAPDADIKLFADAETLDAQGRFLMPGL
jgi:hypothetical protein